MVREEEEEAGKRAGSGLARCRHCLGKASSFLFPDVPVSSLQLFRLPKPGSSLDHEDEIGEYDYNNPNDTSNFCPAAQVTGSKNISLCCSHLTCGRRNSGRIVCLASLTSGKRVAIRLWQS